MSDYQGNAPASPQAFKLLRAQLQELCGICTALTGKHDLSRIWRRIVRNAQLQLNVDGCTYYRIGKQHLHFEVVLCRSLGLVSGSGEDGSKLFPPIPMYSEPDSDRPNPNSVAAQAAVEGRTINIPNVKRLMHYPDSETLDFDKRMGYETNSMLTIPIRFQSEPVTGVLQLINAKDAAGAIVDFDSQREEVATALAALIAMAAKLR